MLKVRKEGKEEFALGHYNAEVPTGYPGYYHKC